MNVKCHYCGNRISIFRILAKKEYCCEDHKWSHLEDMNRRGLAVLMGFVSDDPGLASSELPLAAKAFDSGSQHSQDPRPPGYVRRGPGIPVDKPLAEML